MWTLQSLLDYCNQHNIDVFEGCETPEPIDLNLLKSHIMLRCGLLQPIYGEPLIFQMQTKMWFAANQWRMDHLVKMLLADYSPAENIYEHDHWEEEHSGTDEEGGDQTLEHGETHTLSGDDTFEHGETHTLSGQDDLTHGEIHTLSGTDTDTDSTGTEHTVSAYNAATYQPDSMDQKSGSIDHDYGKTDTASGTDTQEYGKVDTASGTDTTTYGKTDTASGTDTTTYGKTDTASGTDTTTYGKTDTASGTDTTTYGKTDTASGTDTTTYGRTDTASGTDTTTYGKTDTASGTDTTTFGKTFTHGEKIEYTRDRNGNVGVKSSSDLMQEEINLLERFNVYDLLASWYEKDLMIQVY